MIWNRSDFRAKLSRWRQETNEQWEGAEIEKMNRAYYIFERTLSWTKARNLNVLRANHNIYDSQQSLHLQPAMRIPSTTSDPLSNH